jgi:molybdate transport system substrate-binding protein
MTACGHRGLRIAMAPLIALLVAGLGAPTQADEPILVYAAASMTNVVEEIVGLCGSVQPVSIKTSFAASSVLAKQIEHGAEAAVFLSANSAWMDYLEHRDMLANDTRHRLAGNSLVIIAPASSPPPENLVPVKVLATLPAGGRVAMGDPDHVPAGIYAKAALEHIHAWEGIRERVARTANVRAALALVETGAVSLGIVYATDALASRRVRVVAGFPPESNPPIVYETALLREHDTPAARRLYACMRGAGAARILERHGFLPLGYGEYADAG